MIDNEKEVFTGFLEKIYGITKEEVASLYNEAGELANVDLVLQKDSARVAKYKIEKDNQFKAGEKKAHEKIEKHLKEKYNVIDTELIGSELIDHVVEAQTTELQEKLSKKFNSDDIEKNPAFIAKRKEWETNLSNKDKEWESKLTAKESEWNQRITLDQVTKNALNILEANYMLPENSERAAYLKEVFANEIRKGKYNLTDGSEPVVLDKDEKPLEDAHGRMISFKEHTEGLAAKLFDKKVANQRSNAANQSQSQGSPIVIKDQSDLSEKMAQAKTAEQRAEVTKAAKAAGLM